jgi:enoyl-CoA hydratase
MSVDMERRGQVLVLSIVRPAKRNAIDEDISQGLERGLDELDTDPGLRVGVLTGTTDVFSAGTDLRVGPGARTERGGEYGMIRRRRTKPLIAAVEGVAFGGGMEIALACDLVVASTTARFALPEARRGVIATSGALFRAPWSLPPNVAMEMMVAGGELRADRAFQVGFVNRVTEAGLALDEAVALAQEICRSSPVAVAETLAVIAAQRQESEDQGWRSTEASIARVRTSEDCREGIAAFFARRAPRWTGR